MGKVDAVVTDPPYAMTDLEWDKAFDIGRWWDLVEAVTGKGKATVLTASQPFTSLMVMSRRSRFRTEWIWKKNAGSNFATTKWHPMKEHESVLVFGDGPTTYNPIKQPRSSPLKAGYTNTSNTGKRKAYSGVMVNKGFTVTDGEMRVPSSVQQWNRERGHHPNQKPVEMFGYFIRTYSNEGETVLDPFMGSGTTGVACVKTGRKFIGIELDPAYCEIAKQRIEKALSERGQAVA
ncbi:MAG: DNA-methyltransferase [Bacteroidota bacterium]